MGINFDIITVIHQASITDWIQAFAAVLAVVGTVFTLWKLYQRDEQKQAMIEELRTQTTSVAEQTAELKAQTGHLGQQVEQMAIHASESVKQTGHLADQVAQLGQQVFQLERIHEAIAKGIEFMANDERLNTEIKKIEMRPDFEFQSHVPKPGRVESTLNLLNRGGLARNLRLEKVEGVTITARCPEEVRPGDKMSAHINTYEMMEISPIYDLYFTDAIGNKYVQRFDMRYGVPKTGTVRTAEPTDQPVSP